MTAMPSSGFSTVSNAAPGTSSAATVSATRRTSRLAAASDPSLDQRRPTIELVSVERARRDEVQHADRDVEEGEQEDERLQTERDRQEVERQREQDRDREGRRRARDRDPGLLAPARVAPSSRVAAPSQVSETQTGRTPAGLRAARTCPSSWTSSEAVPPTAPSTAAAATGKPALAPTQAKSAPRSRTGPNALLPIDSRTGGGFGSSSIPRSSAAPETPLRPRTVRGVPALHPPLPKQRRRTEPDNPVLAGPPSGSASAELEHADGGLTIRRPELPQHGRHVPPDGHRARGRAARRSPGWCDRPGEARRRPTRVR